MFRSKHGGDGDRGGPAVEMALVLPLLVVMVFGIIDFSRIFNAEIQLSQAAREGVRIAALADGTSTTYVANDVKARVFLAAPSPAFGSTQPAVPTIDMCPNSAKLAKVVVTYDYVGILFSFTGTKKLSQAAVMICGG